MIYIMSHVPARDFYSDHEESTTNSMREDS